MKLSIVLFLILFFSQQISAENKDNGKTELESPKIKSFYISGTVNDVVTGESLVGVQVQIEGTDLKTYTDFDGNFSFVDIKQGEYKLVANYISYKSTSQVVTSETSLTTLKLKMENTK